MIVNYEDNLQTVTEPPNRAKNTQEEQGSQLQGSQESLQTDESSGALSSLQNVRCPQEYSQELNILEPGDEVVLSETIDEKVECIDIDGDAKLEQRERMIDDDQ